jgi:hypothetical protein
VSTSFRDGPAGGVLLELKRAPLFLRVTQLASTGKFDALDQLDDKPMADERIFVYVLEAKPVQAHIRRGNGGGWLMICKYKYHEPQPTDAEMRTNEAWREWTKTAVRQINPDELAKLK